MYRVVHISQQFGIGGAGIAAWRIIEALSGSDQIKIATIADKVEVGETLEDTKISLFQKIEVFLRRKIDNLIKFVAPKIIATVSINIFPSRWGKKINALDADIIHLHRIGGQMLSVRQIGSINKPIVWTLHDLWPLNGVAHLAISWPDKMTMRLRIWQYIDRILQRKKRQIFDRTISKFIVPSEFCKNLLIKNYNVSEKNIAVIPIPVPQNILKASTKIKSTAEDRFTLLYSALDADRDPNKGLLDLMKVVKYLDDQLTGTETKLRLITVGFNAEKIQFNNIEWEAYDVIHEKEHIIALYKQANLCIIPSYFETFGQVALEAQALGVPVLHYDGNGIDDIVVNGVTGLAVSNGDVSAMKKVCLHYIEQYHQGSLMCGDAISQMAKTKFSPQRVHDLHLAVYQSCYDENQD